MTIGGINTDDDDDVVPSDELREEIGRYIKENYEVGDYFKSKYFDLEIDTDNKMIGKNIPKAAEETDGLEIELWSEGNGNLWKVTKNEES